MAEYKLTYFDIRGTGELIRILFAAAKVPYEDIRIIPVGNPAVPGTLPTLPAELKEKLPFGQVPILEYKGTTLSQSATIGRFLARKFNMMGADDWEAAKIDEILDAIKDFGQGFKAIRLATDEAEKALALKNVNEISGNYLTKFSAILTANGGEYLVGKSLSIADISLYYGLTYATTALNMDVTQNFPKLKEFIEKIGSIPSIKEWIEKRPQPSR